LGNGDVAATIALDRRMSEHRSYSYASIASAPLGDAGIDTPAYIK
jgi:hypothetical protein